ncbi:glycosyl hydrolase [Metabacillus malikii]|uniref:Mannan endo-1,4-beta-mannosidase n=1 Tax=Metabacillus malikii TaxID=1504265 RepID=A0ABT9ZGK1_9BACI|nr:glycosyl hydrolase [Metabacillus malikii]MDQ0231415.1 mannan endo-1,4-beta-mannosidase [Metabacillus malikii]
MKCFQLYKLLIVGVLLVLIVLVNPQPTIAVAEKNNNELILEAEEASLNGVTIENSEPGYSGKGYVADFSDTNQSVTFSLNIPEASLYDVTVGFGAIYGDGKVANILLNGEPLGTITMGSGFGEASAGKVLFKKGMNTLTITPNWTFFAIDYIKVAPNAAPAPHEVEKKLINSQATAATKGLFHYLVDNFGENIISGQQGNPNDNLADIKYIEKLTGKLPAILGLDLMDYSPSRVEYGASSDAIERAIDWHNHGGIIAFAWHWNAPKDLLNTTEHPWWSGFNTDATTFDIEYALKHPESEDYNLLLRDIDAIAEQLKKLQEANVPVLWRPLHEAEGGWFWWGAKGPEPVKELWKLMYDRMTNQHKLNNLIWVWNSIDEDWYPGNEYVDIVSFDSYPGAHQYIPQSSQYEALVNVSNNKKLVAMAENGPIPDPDVLADYRSKYIYFTTWNGLLAEQNSEEHLKKVYHHKNVITREQLPDFETYAQQDSPRDDESDDEETTPPKGDESDGDVKVPQKDEEVGNKDDSPPKNEPSDNGEKDATKDKEVNKNESAQPTPHEANKQDGYPELEDEKTPKVNSSENNENGNSLPNTATSLYSFLLLGFAFVMLGMIIAFTRRKEKTQG